MNRITLITLTMAMTAWLGTTAEGTDKAMPASAVNACQCCAFIIAKCICHKYSI